MNAYKEILVASGKIVMDSRLMMSVASRANDSHAYALYTDRAMQAEDIAEYCRQKIRKVSDQSQDETTW